MTGITDIKTSDLPLYYENEAILALPKNNKKRIE